MKEANSTSFQFHLQRKSNRISLCNAHLATCNMSNSQTQTEHSLKWLWNVRNICAYLTTSNSLVTAICDTGPGLERQWAPPGALRAFSSYCLKRGVEIRIKPPAYSWSTLPPTHGSCLLTSTGDMSALTEKKYELHEKVVCYFFAFPATFRNTHQLLWKFTQTHALLLRRQDTLHFTMPKKSSWTAVCSRLMYMAFPAHNPSSFHSRPQEV